MLYEVITGKNHLGDRNEFLPLCNPPHRGDDLVADHEGANIASLALRNELLNP